VFSVILHYCCVQKIRRKQFVMSEVKEGNENVKCMGKPLNGTNCLGEVFVYPCAACLPQSITRKDKLPQEERMSAVRRRRAGEPGSHCPWQHRAAPQLSLYRLHCNLTAVKGRSRNRQAQGSWPSNPDNNLANTKLKVRMGI
jgi:hypothetical protein